MTNFTIANNHGYGDKKDTDFIECVAWRRLGEAVANYAYKGSKVLVDGRLKRQSWKNKNGENRTKYYVLCRRVEFLSPKLTQDELAERYHSEDPGGGYSMDSDAFIKDEDAPF